MSLPDGRACRCSTTIDRKSTRLNSSHVKNSYAAFCLKKKKLRGHELERQLSGPDLGDAYHAQQVRKASDVILVPVGEDDVTDLFFFHDTATNEIYTLSLHDALPIYVVPAGARGHPPAPRDAHGARAARPNGRRSAEHTSEHQSRETIVCRLLLA